MNCPFLKEHMPKSEDGKCPVRGCPEFKKYFDNCNCKCGADCKCENCECNENTKCPYLKGKGEKK